MAKAAAGCCIEVTLPRGCNMSFDIAIAPFDAAVLVTYLVAVVLFGLWMGRGQRDMNGYLLGGRDLPWWAILGSIVATETSTVTFLSVPGLTFATTQVGSPALDPAVGGDMRFLQLACGLVIGRWLIVQLLLPLYFRGRLFTAYQVLHERFGGATKNVASIVFLLARNVGDGLRLFLTAIVLEKLIGLPLPICIVLIGLLTIAYTFFGGIKSVVWNDCIQFVVYVAGGILALVVILQRLPGGWPQFVSFAERTSKFRLLDASVDLSVPFTLWAGIIGGAFLSLGTHGTDQMMVQRYLCARSERQAGRALLCSGFVVVLQFALFLRSRRGTGLLLPPVSTRAAVRAHGPRVHRVYCRGASLRCRIGRHHSGRGLFGGHVDVVQLAEFVGLRRGERPLSSPVRQAAVRSASALDQPTVHRAVRPGPDRHRNRRHVPGDGRHQRRVGDRGIHGRRVAGNLCPRRAHDPRETT